MGVVLLDLNQQSSVYRAWRQAPEIVQSLQLCIEDFVVPLLVGCSGDQKRFPALTHEYER